MIPKIVHQTSATSDLSWEERALRRRLRRLLPDWEVRLWTDEENRQLVAEHFPQHLAVYDGIGRGVVKADIARLIYMHAFGGFYLDTDYKLLRPFEDAMLSKSCILPIESGEFGQSSLRIGNAVFASEAGHPLWGEFINHVFETNIPMAEVGAVSGGSTVNGISNGGGVVSIAGPLALTRFYLANQASFSGISHPDIIEFHPNQLTERSARGGGDPSTYGVHLCWGSWRGKKSIGWLKNQVRRKLLIL